MARVGQKARRVRAFTEAEQDAVMRLIAVWTTATAQGNHSAVVNLSDLGTALNLIVEAAVDPEVLRAARDG